MLFVDSDNALGSLVGDVDDAFALAALMRSGIPITAISSCAGNTSEPEAYANNRRLAGILRWPGRLLRGDEARGELQKFPGRIVALGPLTNVAGASRASEVIIVGGNSRSRGRWPPVWPFEFNLTRDRTAALSLFNSPLPLTVFPLNVARHLTATRDDIAAIPGAAAEFLARNSARWFRHLRRVRFTGNFPIYDLAAALYGIEDRGFVWSVTTAELNSRTALRFGRGTRPVRVCVGLDRRLLWQRFVDLLQGA